MFYSVALLSASTKSALQETLHGVRSKSEEVETADTSWLLLPAYVRILYLQMGVVFASLVANVVYCMTLNIAKYHFASSFRDAFEKVPVSLSLYLSLVNASVSLSVCVCIW